MHIQSVAVYNHDFVSFFFFFIVESKKESLIAVLQPMMMIRFEDTNVRIYCVHLVANNYKYKRNILVKENRHFSSLVCQKKK